MEILKNTLYRNGILFTKIDKVTPHSFFIVSEDETIRIKYSQFTDFEIKCSSCSKITKVKKIQKRHLENDYFCSSCRRKGERNPMFGYKFSEEERQKMSENRKGEKNAFYGKKHTEETKNKISQANKGKLCGEKNPMYGIDVYAMLTEQYGNEYVNKIKQKISEKCAGEKNGFFGKHHSEETKKYLSDHHKNSANIKNMFKNPEWQKNQREGMLKSEKLKESRQNPEYRLKKRLQWYNMHGSRKNGPSFNRRGCEVFDKIMEEKNIHIQHALNGGEFYIKELGYWVDGYDAENNVVYEYDEKFHYRYGELKEEDVRRQKEIEDLLKCKFIRIKDEDYKNYINNKT